MKRNQYQDKSYDDEREIKSGKKVSRIKLRRERRAASRQIQSSLAEMEEDEQERNEHDKDV